MNLAICLRVAALAATLALASAPATADDYRDTVDRAYSELQEFKDWLQARLDELKEETVELKNELEDSEAADKDRLEGMIADLEAMSRDIQDELDELGSATEDRWEGAKASALSGWHRVQAAYYAALAELHGEAD
jgi:predicted nuclease with TOPRIM domain